MERTRPNKGSIAFIKESISNIRTVGTITRSSALLCKRMIKPIDFEHSKVLVELGAGDGVVTKHILKNMRQDAKLLCFEINDLFCKKLQEIKDDRLIIIQDSAENLLFHLKQHGYEQTDNIISALPFTIIPEQVSMSIINTCVKALKISGKFVQIHYALFPKKNYKKAFGNVSTSFVLLNIPPAWVMVSNREN